jgi:arylsulfatase A-like enzyme
MGHTTFGVAGDYGAWVRGQLNETEFKALSTATNLAQHPFGGEAWDWQMPHALHNSVWTAERSIAWLNSRPQGDPFFLAVGFQDPHAPHALPLDFNDRVDASSVPLPDFTPGELDDKPAYFGQVHRGEFESSCWRGEYPMAGQAASCVLDYRKVTEAEARQGRAYYYGMVQLMDAQLGRILDALDEAGLSDNTLIIFTSDHGDLLGDHGLWQKGPFHYEQMINVPLLMRWPAALEGQRQSTDLISLCDIAPTVMAAACLPVPAEMDGVNTLAVLNEGSASARDHVLVECIDNPDKLRLKTIVTADAKLTRYAGVDWGELYDLQNDPREKVNLWDDPAHAAKKAHLLNRLLHDLEPLERRRPRLCYA